jgi:serine/threonine protein kinase
MNQGQGTTGRMRPSRGRGSEREDDRTGAVLCGWTLERRLGVGAVCESWLAGKAGAPDSVVRILRDPFASDPLSRAEWLGASWAANRFSHARVPRVMQDGDDGLGAPVVIRRWANGTALDQIVGSGAMNSRLALQLAEQLLDALEMAHAHGIIHGALSPSNVVVSARGTVRLLDFATAPGPLSKAADALLRARASPYMAPQQRATSGEAALRVGSGRPTEQSDVWSVGACLHFAIAGRPPALNDPRLHRAAPEADADVAAVVDRALAIDPLERYESAYAMLGDIRRVMGGRKPKLQSAAVALPSQSVGEIQGWLESTSGVVGLDVQTQARSDLPAKALPAAERADADTARPSEWLGNLLLCGAIALIVALATFVLVRERLADAPVPSAPSAMPGR